MLKNLPQFENRKKRAKKQLNYVRIQNTKKRYTMKSRNYNILFLAITIISRYLNSKQYKKPLCTHSKVT